MVNYRFLLVPAAFVLMFATQGYAETSTQRLIDQHDHAGLAAHYTHEAQELQEKAKHWDFMADFYEKHPEPDSKDGAGKHAAHCREIAKSYQKAASEAEALAAEHRARRPHNVIN
ncbi:MAG: hypothetical protein KGO52_13455 [Nitrospirota bacterium]|nr:hypothetical protein [Nitrospirota bacterium]MDE3243719.1 hypothetical protein [Nitrospirota bacterium]